MKYISYIFLLLVFIVTACDNETPTSDITFSDVAMVQSVSETGTTFAIAGNDSFVKKHLHTGKILKNEDEDLTGKCIFIKYSFIDKNSGEINLLSASIISNYEAETGGREDISGWDTDNIHLLSYWTIDKTLIIKASLPYYPESRKIALIIDNETTDTDMPHAYLYHSLEDAIKPEDTFNRNYYVAFDLEKVTSGQNWSGIILHFNDSENKNSLITIDF